MVSFFDIGSLFLIFVVGSEVKQTLAKFNIFNNALEPCFPTEPPLWKMNDEYSDG